MSTFGEELNTLDFLMLHQLDEFRPIVVIVSETITELSDYPDRFVSLLKKLPDALPISYNDVAVELMMTYLDIINLQHEFLNHLLRLPDTVAFFDPDNAIGQAHETLNEFSERIITLANMKGGE